MRLGPATLLAGLLLSLEGSACTRPPPPDPSPTTTTREFLSKGFSVDQLYRSMQGPVDQQWTAVDEGSAERLWITGVDVEAIDPKSGRPIDDGQQFICHVNLSHPSPEAWEKAYRARRAQGRSLPFNYFTLIQGHYDLDFPPGFGLPLPADEKIRVMSMAMNQRPGTDPFEMQIRTRVHYQPESELEAPLVPLNKFSFDVRVPSPDPFGEHAHLGAAGEGCAELDSPEELRAAREDLLARHDGPRPEFERRLHFAVPPGRHEYRSTVPGDRKIPFDTTAHHISAHLHVFGESLELIDKTTGKSIFKSTATSNSGETGVVHMSHVASPEGIPMFRDHDYEVVARYNNTTDQPVDGMAVVYIYYRDEPPLPGEAAAARAG